MSHYLLMILVHPFIGIVNPIQMLLSNYSSAESKIKYINHRISMENNS